jgi:hypothetical protein
VHCLFWFAETGPKQEILTASCSQSAMWFSRTRAHIRKDRIRKTFHCKSV